MGKTTDVKQSETKYEQSPEQRQIMQSAMSQYMAGGHLPENSPTFDYNNNPDLQERGRNFVAPFSTPSLQAFTATEANYGAQQPTMNMAKGLTMGAAGDAGQFQGGPDGWSTDADGRAVYHDYATGVGKYMSPFIGNVINSGLGFLDTARQRQNLTTNNDTVSKGSFGGTRQAVRQSLDDASYAAQGEKLISDNLQAGFQSAQGEYNQGFSQGQQALQYNQSTEAQNLARRLAAGHQLGDQAVQDQGIIGRDIDALRNVGVAVEDKDQMMRDKARETQLQDNTWGLSVAQMLAGLTPPPSSSTTTKNSVPNSSIWGTAASAGANAAASAMMMSDERAKTKVSKADPEDALAQIRKLKPRSFEYTPLAQEHHGAPSGQRDGFMAQDLEQATGEAAPEHGGFKHVDVAQHLGRLTHAVQALDQQMRSKYGSKKRAA